MVGGHTCQLTRPSRLEDFKPSSLVFSFHFRLGLGLGLVLVGGWPWPAVLGVLLEPWVRRGLVGDRKTTGVAWSVSGALLFGGRLWMT